MKKELNRESNFEFLRIVSMLFIILHHLVVYSNFEIINSLNVNGFILNLFRCGGKLGVILFVMITGYYMINKREIKIKKLIGLELQVLFYSIVLFIIFSLFGNVNITSNLLFKILFPNISKVYWFFSSYFILYLCIPYLNKLILNISKKEIQKLLIVGFIFLIFIPSVVIYNGPVSSGVYLFYYYIVGAYIKLYLKEANGCKRYLLSFSVFYLMIVGLSMFIKYLSFSNVILIDYIYSFADIDSILVFVSGISLFLFFKNLKIKQNKFINLIASTSFGVYLFHEHTFMRTFLWEKMFSVDKLLNGGFVLFKGLSIAGTIYMVGTIFEFIRKVIFKYFSNVFKCLKRN